MHLFQSNLQKEQRFVRTYTGAELTQDQFNSYKDQFSLRNTFNKAERKKYWSYGTPGQISSANLFNDILSKLGSEGVVFDLEKQPKLLKKFDKHIRSYLGQGSWPFVPTVYHHSEILQNKMKEIRAEYNYTLAEFTLA